MKFTFYKRWFPYAILGIVLFAATAALIFFVQRDGDPSARSQASSVERNPVSTASPRSAVSAAAALTAVSEMGTVPGQSLMNQIDRLVASNDPNNVYKAYALIRDCAEFNRHQDRAIFDVAEVATKHNVLPWRAMTGDEKRLNTVLCSQMTERTRLSRIDYLAAAAKGGVPGAAIEMADQGPFGDPSALNSRPDDPIVQEWKRTVMEQLSRHAEEGDSGVLAYLWAREATDNPLTGRNPSLAYRYLLAQGLILRDLEVANNLAANDLGSVMYGPLGPLASNIDGLTEEQRKTESAAAQRIADTARAQRKFNVQRH